MLKKIVTNMPDVNLMMLKLLLVDVSTVMMNLIAGGNNDAL
jgi:hypothetical protein